MRISFVLLFHLFLLSALSAQLDYELLQWGEVSGTDRLMTVYEADSTAQAVILADQALLYLNRESTGYEQQLKRHRRIKILDEAAIQEWADVRLVYYHEGGAQQIRRLVAQTIAPDGTITEVTKKAIFRDKIDDEYSAVTFSFPNVQVGSILEYRYEETNTYIVLPDSWYFRHTVPVRSSYYRFHNDIPAVYTYLMQGIEYMEHEKVSDKHDRFHLGDMSFDVSTTEFWMQNGQALKREPFITTLTDYQLMVRFQLNTIYNSNGTSQEILSTWKKTAQDLVNNESVGKTYSKSGKIKPIIEACTAALDPNETDKIYAISSFVQQNMEWNGEHRIFTNGSLKDAFTRRSGNSAELQYTGLALLRHFGYEAYPVILSTRSHGAMIEQFPFVRQFNYVILIVKNNGRWQLLDLTDPTLKPGLVRIRALNHKGFLVHEEEPGWMDIQVPLVQDIFAFDGQIAEDGSISGKMKLTQRAYSARSERKAMLEKSLTEIWSPRFPEGSTLDSLTLENVEDPRNDLRLAGNFNIPDAGFVNDDFIYLTPYLYTAFSENPFKQEDRTFPVDFPHPFEEKSVYSLKVPEGYEIISVPENLRVNLPDNKGYYHLMASASGGKIRLLSNIHLEATYFTPAEYPALRDMFEQATQKLQEQIVLKKAQ